MKSHATCKDLYELIRTDRKIFIVAWITYIYVWQRFERYFSHHRAKWIDLFPLYIVLTRKLGWHSENSKIFSDYVRKLKVKDDEILVSFDVTSLYTNVPVKETLVIIKTLMENDADLQNKTNIPPKDLLDITEFLLTKTWFLFDGTFFKQTDRVAMGGPASSVVADNRALTTFENSPRIYKRFVDDIVSIIKRENNFTIT